MTPHYQALVAIFQKAARIEHATTFLQWDHMVMMPMAGNEARSAALAELKELHHGLLTDPKIAELLDLAKNDDIGPQIRIGLKEMERSYSQAVCLPADLVKAQALAGAKCEHQWRSQRRENDWAGFAENFKEVVNLSRKEAEKRYAAKGEDFSCPYDALLDLYCTGDSSKFIATIFSRLKKELPGLVEEILAQQEMLPTVSDHFPIREQKKLCQKAMAQLGFDFNAGRLDVSAHPFSTGCRGDQRITTRFNETDFLSALFATAHETGHAAYEAGLPAALCGLPQGQARNLCLHESQSLFFEKQILLSRPFFSFFATYIHEFLPASKGLSAKELWRLATRVEPSYIRVEADEATYPLHVILRFEIEKDLINGDIEVDDIPELWELKMGSYLGLSCAGDHRNGCLQDMHWTDGSFGYFPSYTIGALNSAQLFAAFQKESANWQEDFARGSIDSVRNWLEDKIWSIGSTMESQEIIEKATGEKTNPDIFLTHLRNRYLKGLY